VTLLLALLPATVLAAKPTPVRIWAASSAEKIGPDAPARALGTVRISAARNEFEAFQVVVTGAARGVTASASALAGPALVSDVRLYRTALVSVTRASAPDGATGRWPDALVPDVDELDGQKRNAFPFDTRAGESRAIWVEVFVPPGTPAGVYTGSVTVRHQRGSAAVPVELTVWGFELPSTSTTRSAFGLSWGALPSGHGFASWDIETFARLRERYGRLALDHRISLSRHDDGNWNDLAHFERWYGALADGIAPTRLAGARLTAIEYLGPLSDEANLRRWATHHAGRGSLFQYTCDEPPYQGCSFADAVARATAASHAGVPALVTTTVDQADAAGLSPVLDLVVPVVNFIDDKSGTYAGNQRADYDAFLAADPANELWLYQSCMSHGCGGSSAYDTGWPSYMIDASAVRNRAMGWLLFRYDATGELYWETAYAFSGDAWTDQWAFDGNGDGTLFYPGTPARIGGTTHVPVASIRLKMIREGLEDGEYLRLLARLGDPGLARQLADELFPAASATERSPSALLEARARLAARILELRGAAP
jgi:hypothetical protein